MSKALILKNHIDFKRISITSEAKLKDIERYIGKFINSSKKNLDKFEEEDIVKFINSLEYSIGTINGLKSDIKVFIKWYYPDWSARFRNLDKILKQQKAPKSYQPEQMINFEEFEKLVVAENNLLWKAYWLTMFYGGFRPSEASRLKWDQVFFEPEGVIIKLHATKTNKDFYKSLPINAEQLLKELKQNSTSEYLFPSIQTGKPMGARTICARLKRISKKVLGKEVVPYALRHSIATILYSDDNRKDSDTANQMGHNKSMKETYMNLNEEQIKSKARKLWTKTKPMTKDEKAEFEAMKKQISILNQILISRTQLDRDVANNFLKDNPDDEKALRTIELTTDILSKFEKRD